jgi:hypothetical protein
MEMRSARMFGICGLVIVGLACGKGHRDTSKIVATVAGEKITEKMFTDAVHNLFGDDARANEILTNPLLKDQRNELLAQFVDQKVMSKFGDKQGLDKDPKAKLLLEAAKSNAYGQVLLERAVGKIEPTEAQLKAFYDKAVEKAKAAGQDKGFPPFEAVKAQLPNAWKRDQMQEASQKLVKDAKAQIVTTVDPQWKANSANTPQ